MSHMAQSNTRLGAIFVLVGMVAISINDTVVKELSGGYPLHQIVFLRASIGILFSLVLLQLEGGWKLLKTRQPGLHLLRALSLTFANLLFFTAIAVLPLGLTTAIFFVAPLLITLLSVPILGTQVGPRRLAAVGAGLLGVVIITSSDSSIPPDTPLVVLLLPIGAAACYALMQVLTAKLGAEAKASAMSVYIQANFIVVSLGFFLVAGDGRFVNPSSHESLIFLLRAWVWPMATDWPLIVAVGVLSGIVGYTLSAGYRLGEPATLAPLEYVALPFAMLWGWLVFDEAFGLRMLVGSALIVGAGLYVFWRERRN